MQQDFRLKFTRYKIGNGVTIMSGASVARQLLARCSRLVSLEKSQKSEGELPVLLLEVAMCDAGDGAVLRPGSLTWKGDSAASLP